MTLKTTNDNKLNIQLAVKIIYTYQTIQSEVLLTTGACFYVNFL